MTTASIAASVADRMVGVLQAALVVSRTNGSNAVVVPTDVFEEFSELLAGRPAEPAVPLLPQLDRAVFDVAIDSKEPALELRCGRCDSTVCDVVASDGLRPIVRAALTHEEECLAGIRAALVERLKVDIVGLGTLTTERLATELVAAGWTKP